MSRTSPLVMLVVHDLTDNYIICKSLQSTKYEQFEETDMQEKKKCLPSIIDARAYTHNHIRVCYE